MIDLMAYPLSDGMAPLQSLKARLDFACAQQERGGKDAHPDRRPLEPRLAWPPEGLSPLVDPDDEVWGYIGALFDLTPLELDLLVIAAAADIDTVFGEAFARLQGGAGRPTLELAIDLVSADRDGRARARALLTEAAPLRRTRLISVAGDWDHLGLLSCRLSPHPALVDMLAGGDGPSAACGDAAAWSAAEPRDPDGDVPPQVWARLIAWPGPLRLQLAGRDPQEREALAAGLALARGQRLLRLDRAPLTAAEAPAALEAICFEARLRGGALAIIGDATPNEPDALAALPAAWRRNPIDVILLGEDPWTVAIGGATPEAVKLAPRSLARRRDIWRDARSHLGLPPDEAGCERLAHAVDCGTEAAVQALSRSFDRPEVSVSDILDDVRDAAPTQLNTIAARIRSRRTWDDLVLPPEVMAQLRGVEARWRSRERVEADWGFAAKLDGLLAHCALFSGPSGAGKTMAAGVLARALDLDLYRIDLSQTVSKYIGETEKTLDRIFNFARDSGAALLFDEADALFGKRSEVKDAHDRYANIEVGFLLQRMETHSGLTILATNLRSNIDEAFTRRLAAIIEFPFPEAEDRERILRGLFPDAAPIAADLDLSALARAARLSGGALRNIVLAAAFAAADAGLPINLTHLRQAARTEHEKLGRAWDGASEFEGED